MVDYVALTGLSKIEINKLPTIADFFYNKYERETIIMARCSFYIQLKFKIYFKFKCI